MKNFTVPVAVFVGILGCVLAVSANVTAMQRTKQLEHERYRKLMAEQQVQKAQAMIQQLEQQIADSKDKIDTISQVINAGKESHEALTAQLDALRAENKKLSEAMRAQAAKASSAVVPEPAMTGEMKTGDVQQ